MVALILLLISLVGQLSIIRLAIGPLVRSAKPSPTAAPNPYYAGAALLWTMPLLSSGRPCMR